MQQIILKQHIKYLTQKNPNPPTLNAQLKLHKPGAPIRPVVNNRTALSYNNSLALMFDYCGHTSTTAS